MWVGGSLEASPQLTVAPLGVFKPNYVGLPISGADVAAFEGTHVYPWVQWVSFGVKGRAGYERVLEQCGGNA